MLDNGFCMNCETYKQRISDLEIETLFLQYEIEMLQNILNKRKQPKQSKKFRNRLLCLLGIHDYMEDDNGYRRECKICGKTQRRDALAPDGFWGKWYNWS